MSSGSPEDRILAALKDLPDGIDSKSIKELLPNEPVEKIINKMLGAKMVEMVAGEAPGSFFLRRPKGTTLSNASTEEQLVYSLIEEASTQGIWIKDIRDRSGLTETQLKRVLKNLEKQKMVKAIKAIGTARKSYILFNLEADESISGGVFYSNQEIDSSFVKTLIDVSVMYLHKRYKTAFAQNPKKLDALKASCVHVSEVAEYIQQKNICTVNFSEEDVEHILDLAWKRNRIYKQADPGVFRFRPTHGGVDGTTFAICNFCPVRSECRVGNKVSPETCMYLKMVKKADIQETGIGDLDYDSDF